VSPLYDLQTEIRRDGLEACATVTGYLPQEHDLTACIAAADVSLNLRWPTAREISGPWLRALAAGRPSVMIDLSHLVDVPTIDPRTWLPNDAVIGSAENRGIGSSAAEPSKPRSPELPIAVAIDILDEDHSLRLAMRRLATDASLRASLGAAARAYWTANHSIEAMTMDYRRVIAQAAARAEPHPSLPPHLINDGMDTLTALLAPFGLSAPLGGGRLDHSR
jgi:hypothetical protein